MNKQFIRIPGFIEHQIPLLDPYSMKILCYIYSKSFYQNGYYTPIDYSSSDLARILSMSRTIVTDRIAQLSAIGYIIVKDKLLYPLENQGDKICPVSNIGSKKKDVHEMDKQNNYVHEMDKRVHEMDTDVHEMDKKSTKLSTKWTSDRLYDTLEKGFDSLLVFKQYLYSITTVDVADLLKVIENMEKLEVLKTLRKETIGKNLDGFEKNDTFQQCVQWIKEIYNDPPADGQELPVDRYLLYFLIQCIETKNNPAGMFITAVKKLKTDGTRFELDMKEFEKHQQKVDAKEMMQKSVENTRKMLNALDEKERQAIAEEQATDLLFQNNPDLVKAMAPVALEEARKKYGVFALGAKKVDENGNDITEKRERIIQRMARGILKQFILDEKKNTKVG